MQHGGFPLAGSDNRLKIEAVIHSADVQQPGGGDAVWKPCVGCPPSQINRVAHQLTQSCVDNLHNSNCSCLCSCRQIQQQPETVEGCYTGRV